MTRIDLKNIARGSSNVYVGYVLGAGQPRNWVEPKRQKAINTYYANRELALKKHMVRVAKDEETGKEIPIPTYWWSTSKRTGKKNKMYKKDLPEVEDGWMRNAYGICIPKSELVSGYDENDKPILNENVDWDKLKGFELNFQSKHCNPDGEDYVEIKRLEPVEFACAGKKQKLEFGPKKIDIYSLNTSTKTKGFKHTDLIELNNKQIIGYFNYPHVNLGGLEGIHKTDYNTSASSGRQYGNTIFSTEGRIADIIKSDDEDTSHRLLLESEKLPIDEASVTVWLPNDIEFKDYGKYSKVYIIGSTSRRMIGDEWEYPQIQGLGIIPIKKVKPIETEEDEEEVLKSVDEDTYSPEEFDASDDIDEIEEIDEDNIDEYIEDAEEVDASKGKPETKRSW